MVLTVLGKRKREVLDRFYEFPTEDKIVPLPISNLIRAGKRKGDCYIQLMHVRKGFSKTYVNVRKLKYVTSEDMEELCPSYKESTCDECHKRIKLSDKTDFRSGIVSLPWKSYDDIHKPFGKLYRHLELHYDIDQLEEEELVDDWCYVSEIFPGAEFYDTEWQKDYSDSIFLRKHVDQISPLELKWTPYQGIVDLHLWHSAIHSSNRIQLNESRVTASSIPYIMNAIISHILFFHPGLAALINSYLYFEYIHRDCGKDKIKNVINYPFKDILIRTQ